MTLISSKSRQLALSLLFFGCHLAASPLVQLEFNENNGFETKNRATNNTVPIAHVFKKAHYKAVQEPYWVADCVAQSCLKFDGFSTFLSLDGLTNKDVANGLTLSAWVSPQAFEWGDGGKFSAIVSQLNQDETQGLLLGVYRHGFWGVQLATPAGLITIQADKALPVDSWSFISATIDLPTHTIQLYINGKLITRKTLSEEVSLVMPTTSLLVGRHSNALNRRGEFTLNMFNGLLDALHIEQGVLSNGDIVAQYNSYLQAHNNHVPLLSLADTTISVGTYSDDKHRPQYHMAPSAHWMNEPHAPFYYKGKYHIFFQKNPHGPFWHQIHWGHLISDDMIHWQEIEIALYPQAGNIAPDGIWSGSAVIDQQGEPILFFTAGNDSITPNQNTAIAMAENLNDPMLRTWKQHTKFVTVQQPDEGVYGQFRDPFVFFDSQINKWTQLVTSGIPEGSGTALVYQSDDLHSWEYKGPLFSTDIKKYPQVGSIWELPVLLPVTSKEGSLTKHIFLINAHGKGSVREIYYWLGHWNPVTARFIPEHEQPKIFDFGVDKMTGPSGFIDPKTGRTIIFTIAQGESTDQQEAESGWAHNGGLPISLWLNDEGDIRFAPIKEVTSLRGEKLVDLTAPTKPQLHRALGNIDGDMLEIELQLESSTGTPGNVELFLRQHPQQLEQTRIILDKKTAQFSVDRNQSTIDPDKRSYGVQGNQLVIPNKVQLRTFLDRSMIESYLNDTKSITTRVYPALLESTGVALNIGDGWHVKSIKIWRMQGSHNYTPSVKPAYFEYTPSTWQSGLANHDFTACDFNSWATAEGSAFSTQTLTDDEQYIELNPSGRIPGKCQYNGALASDKGKATGSLTSHIFTLDANGQINFLLGGVQDIDNAYIAAFDAKTNKEIIRETGRNFDAMRRIFWKLDEYIGQELYIRLVDHSTTDTGYLIFDDIHVPALN